MVPHTPPDDGLPSTDRPSTRRRFLRAGGATALASGLGGCLSTLPPLGGEVAFGRVDAPAVDPPAYRRWLPRPSDLLGLDEEDAPSQVYASPRRMADEAPTRFQPIHQHVALAATDWFGLDDDAYEHVVHAGTAIAIEADVGAGTVADALTAGGYESRGTYEEYDTYARPDDDRFAAVRDGAIVWGDGPESAHDVRAVVDAGAGRADRYHEADDDFATLSARVGASPSVAYGFSWVGSSGASLTAASVRFDDEAVYYVQDLLYPPNASIPVDEIKRDLRSGRRRARRAAAVDVETDGRIASVEMRLPNDRGSSGGIADHPIATWSHEVDSQGGTVTIRHEAGQSVPADHLELAGTDAGHDAGHWSDAYDTVGPGASITVTPADETTTLRVYYAPDESASMTLYAVDLE